MSVPFWLATGSIFQSGSCAPTWAEQLTIVLATAIFGHASNLADDTSNNWTLLAFN